MSTRCYIPNALHICPRCRKNLAEGIDVHSGEPRKCSVCVAAIINRLYSERQRAEIAAAATPIHEDPDFAPAVAAETAAPWTETEKLFFLVIGLLIVGITIGIFLGGRP